MKRKLHALYQHLKEQGLTAAQEKKIRYEMDLLGLDGGHCQPGRPVKKSIYSYNDLQMLHNASPPNLVALTTVQSLDYLLERDKQREKDGFPRKIRVGKMVKPSKDGDDKIVIVPTTVEEKLFHDKVRLDEEGEGEGDGDPASGDGGTGDGEEGEVIGEEQVRPESGGQGGAGQGEGGEHDVESNAYDLGRILTEQFELPNLKDKGKKRSLTKYTYDLTDQNRGFGQVLDKKATLRRIIKTNIALGRVRPQEQVDTQSLLMAPNDRIYRILSKEKDYESQAVVFFVRDYSGSMGGKPTELIVNQHVLIYSWLTYQYKNQVETRFILHDTEAKEVENFQVYYNSTVAGGTQVSSAYKLVNDIVEDESLATDNNIYVFHGTDGDDWDTKGDKALPELEKMLVYASRVGITIAENGYGISGQTEVEKYIKKSRLLEEKRDLLRMDVISKDTDETRLINGIRELIA
ncbi:MAG: uncharacterized sporulation protein YeaH/YhbH (DUF444 family) [Desulforhopalus sp.]|jgi:uncharacterized sporulation protein YeaH/YhbH (DUF444 family)